VQTQGVETESPRWVQALQTILTILAAGLAQAAMTDVWEWLKQLVGFL
jgi:hypothetical protein